MQDAKNRHLGTIAQLCRALSLQLWHVSTIGKKTLNSNISSRRPHNMVCFGALTAEIGLPVWGTPGNFNRFHVLASLVHRCRSSEANQTARSLAVSCAGTLYIHVGGLLPPDGIFLRAKLQNSFCVQVLHSAILAALLHGTPAVGLSQTLRHGTRNGITELSQHLWH